MIDKPKYPPIKSGYKSLISALLTGIKYWIPSSRNAIDVIKSAIKIKFLEFNLAKKILAIKIASIKNSKKCTYLSYRHNLFSTENVMTDTIIIKAI